MTMADIQPLCKANNLPIGYYSGKELFSRHITEKNEAFFYTMFIFV